MKPSEYIESCMLTDVDNYDAVAGRVEELNLVILHALLGITTEAGELNDALKKHLIYGRPLDNINLMEEAGDLMWYISLLLEGLGVSYEEVWEKNIAKLRARYPKRFNEYDATHRDLDEERRILELRESQRGDE